MGSLLKMIGLFGLILMLASTANAQEGLAGCMFDNGEEIVIVEAPEGVTVLTGVVTGLGPNPKHGFHIHESGDLSDGCLACGKHFNPYGKSHGAPEAEERHIGDLGNIETIDGRANVFIFDELVKLSGDPEESVLGRSIVIHENED